MTGIGLAMLIIACVIIILLGVWIIAHYVVKHYTLYRKPRMVPHADYRAYNLQIRTLKIINNAAHCKKCGDFIENHSKEGYVSCSCGEIFIDSSYAFQVVGAKNFDNLVDLSVVSVDRFTINKQ